MSSFTQKQLRVTFSLGDQTASFPGGGNQVVLTGLRTVASISGSVGFLSQLDLQVYGMLASDMNALSVISVPNQPTAIGKNQVLLEGNQGGPNDQWYTIFNGLIIEGGPEYRGMPEVFFHCQAVPIAYFTGKGQTNPLSYQSGAQLSDVLGSISSSMGTGTPQLNGVSGSVPAGSYFPGTPLDQLHALKAKSGNAFDWTIDPSNTLVTLPVSNGTPQPRQGGTQLVLTPTSGLVGYPTAEIMGIGVVALFDPALLGLGTQFQIQGSDIPKANGTWLAYSMSLALEALKLGGGQWHASMHCAAVSS